MSGSAGQLWTPDRDVPLNVKGQEGCSAHEMQTIENLHATAQRLGIQIVCARCGVPFQGLNDGHARTKAIFCKCREIKSESGRSIVPGRP